MTPNNDKDVKDKEDTAMHPTREEFNAAFERLHDKLDANKDHFNEKMSELNTEVTEIRTKVDMSPVVTIPERPCPFFKDHEEEHKVLKHMWLKSIIGAIVSAFVTAIATLFIWVHRGGPE